MEMVINKEKKDLRQRLLERLLSLTQEEIKRRSKNVEDKLSNLPIYKDSKIIMAYYPLKGEVDILEMIRRDMTTKKFCFPVMDLEQKELSVYKITSLESDFKLGPFGVMEPDIGKVKEVDIREIDLIIVPGLAFDHQKNRLGRGAGFYDRFLEKITPSTKKVGIAFEFQILNSLPIHLALDQKVDIIVGEALTI